MGVNAARRVSSTCRPTSPSTSPGETWPDAARAKMSTELCSKESACEPISCSPSPSRSTKSTLDQLCSACPAAAGRFGASAHTILHQGMLRVSCPWPGGKYEDGGSGEAWAKAVEEGEPDADVEREVELAMEKEKGEGKDEGGGLDLLEMD